MSIKTTSRFITTVLALLLILFSIVLQVLINTSSCEAISVDYDDEGSGTIEEACRHCEFRELCVSSLKSDPRSYEANYRGLARIAIELALKNGTDTYAYIKQLEKRTTDPVTKDTLKSCGDYYLTGMVYDIPEALKEFDGHRYGAAAGTLSLCEVCADDCEREFSEQPPGKSRPSPLTHRNEVAGELCSVASDLTLMIAKN